MPSVEEIILSDDYQLSNIAKKSIIDLAIRHIGQHTYEGQPDEDAAYDRLKPTYLMEKLDLLTKADYKFTFKTCENVTDVTESPETDLVGWKYAYQLVDTDPIIGVREAIFKNTPYNHPAIFLTTDEAFKEGYVKTGEAIYEQDDVVTKWHFDQATDLLYTVNEIETDTLRIKYFPQDSKMPIEIIKALKLYMAIILISNDVGKLDFQRQLKEEYNRQITACKRHRLPREEKEPLTQRQKWINDIYRSRGMR